MIALEIIYNLSLLVALSIFSGFIGQRWRQRRYGTVLQGLIFGAVAVIGMLRPLIFQEGIIFDGRSMMISLCGLFFGPLAVAIAGGMAIVCRVFQGGAGAFTGILVILSSALWGVVFYYRRSIKDAAVSSRQLFLFGLIVHAAVLLLMFTLPGSKALGVLQLIGLPVLLIYPLATVLVGKVLSDTISRNNLLNNLRKNEEFNRRIVETTNEGIWVVNSRDETTFVNQKMADLLGYARDEMLGTPASTFMPTEDIPNHQRKIDERKSGKGGIYERRFVKKDGTELWTIVSATPILGSNGSFDGSFGMFTDITDHKRAENLLRESEEKYRLIAENTADSIVVLDLSLKNTYVSPSTIKLKGFSVEETLAQTIEQTMTPESLQLVYQTFEEEMALEQNGTADPARSRILVLEEYCKDRSTIWVENTLSFIRDDKQIPTGILSVSRDVTERKRTDEELRRNEARLRRSQQVGHVGSWEFDLQSGKIWSSDEGFRIYGLPIPTNNELSINRFEGCVPERARVHRALIDLIEKSAPYQLEFAINPADGSSQRDISSVAELVYNDKGFPFKVIGVIQDITSRKQAEESLRLSEEKFHKAFYASPDTFVITRVADGRIVEVNEEFLRMAGCTKDEVLNSSTIALNMWANPTERDRVVATLRKTGSIRGRETVFRIKDGILIDCLYSGEIIQLHGEPHVLSIIRDITERKRLEREREELISALQDKNDEMESMLYASSHDLRTPLVNIAGFNSRIQHLIKDMNLLLDESLSIEKFRAEVRQIITAELPVATGYIAQSAEKMNGLVDGILKLSRLGRATHTPEIIDMNALIWRVWVMLDFQIRQAQATVTVNNLPSCWGDPHELEQAFTNLIDNAIKYRDSSRPLTINITGIALGQHIAYSIEDNGIGIKKEHQEQIWGLFFRLDPAGPVAGDGLGLAVVKRIIQRNRGKIWVESERGVGSKFYLSLPHDRKNISHDRE